MLFPLLWYVDGPCTIKIVEMAAESLYAFKVRNNPHFQFVISFSAKTKHIKLKMRFLGSPWSDCDGKVATNHKSICLTGPPA